MSSVQIGGVPNAEALAHLLGPSTQVTRRIEILNSDLTPWKTDAGLITGSVSVSQSREERRTFQVTLDNEDGSLNNYPGGFWYDKIIRIYRGITYPGGFYETQLGEFLIDNISSAHFPDDVEVSGRDYTKKLLTSKFTQATSFAANQAPEQLIKTIAQNGGISSARMVLPTTGIVLDKERTFERGVERWKAIKEIATAFGYEVFFDAQGYLVMQVYRDPVTTPEVWTFDTGPYGNMISFRKSASDTRIYNSVVVTGEATDVAVPAFGIAKNTEPTSPTRIAAIGERVYQYTSSFITTNAQAQDVANKFLKVHALEQFEVSIDSLVFPWLEVGEIIVFLDPTPNPFEPTRYLLSDLTIPLELGAMQGAAKRVSVVG